VRPPASSARATPKDTIAITVTQKSIMVGDKRRVELNNGVARAEDKRIPYDLLSKVLYTAGQSELDKFRFIILQKNPD
jgi:hypothetical protein